VNIGLRVTATTRDGRRYVYTHTVRRTDRMPDKGVRLERLMLADLLGDLARKLYRRDAPIDGVTIEIDREELEDWQVQA
jgi:hypothetical protein